MSPEKELETIKELTTTSLSREEVFMSFKQLSYQTQQMLRRGASKRAEALLKTLEKWKEEAK